MGGRAKWWRSGVGDVTSGNVKNVMKARSCGLVALSQTSVEEVKPTVGKGVVK